MEKHPRVPYPTDAESVEFWAGCRDGYLLISRCRACGRFHFYSRRRCPFCHSPEVETARAAGSGTIHSFTVVRRAPDEYFKTQAPYVVGLIELTEGPRLTSWVVGVPIPKVRVGMPVQVEFVDLGDNLVLHQFAADRG